MAMTTSSPLRLAATCMAIRQPRDRKIEVLMVQRNPELSFGGMWTFPGGVVEPADGPVPDPLDEDTQRWEQPSLLATAAQAAVRETAEETALKCQTGSLAWFSHWIPPKIGPPKRFATWFFLAPEHSGEIVVDQTENAEARWVTASKALEMSAEGLFPLATPTWITLDDLAHFQDVPSLIDSAISQGPRWYHTHALGLVGPDAPGMRALCWPGDAGYENSDIDAPGPRNRVVVDDKFSVTERLYTVGVSE